MEWLIARVGVKIAWSIALAVLLGGAFGGYVLWDKVTDWWDGRNLDKVTAQRDTALAERDVARKDAETSDKTQAAASAAREQNDEALPAQRERTRARVERPDPDVGQRLRDDAEAVADYQAAAGRLRGARAR